MRGGTVQWMMSADPASIDGSGLTTSKVFCQYIKAPAPVVLLVPGNPPGLASE